jgi:hypothetical protein
MTNDKDSAVLADQTLATAYRDWRLSTTASPIHYKPMALAFVAGWKAALRQPTQTESYRLIQDGQPVAWAEGSKADVEIAHYAAVYGQDGPVKIQQNVKGRWKNVPPPEGDGGQ